MREPRQILRRPRTKRQDKSVSAGTAAPQDTRRFFFGRPASRRFVKSSERKFPQRVSRNSEDILKKKTCAETGKAYRWNLLFATLAQLVEHLIRNERVVGSSPTSGSIFLSSRKRATFRTLSFLPGDEPRKKRRNARVPAGVSSFRSDRALRSPQWRKWRWPVKIIAMPRSFAASMTS